MKNMIDPTFNVVERPYDVQGYITAKSELYDKLASSLAVMDRTKAISFHLDEAKKLFGAHYKYNIKQQTKKRGVLIGVGMKDSTIFVWRKEKV